MAGLTQYRWRFRPEPGARFAPQPLGQSCCLVRPVPEMLTTCVELLLTTSITVHSKADVHVIRFACSPALATVETRACFQAAAAAAAWAAAGAVAAGA